LFPLFATGIPVANLPLVSTTPAVSVANFAAGVVDTGVVDTGVVDTVLHLDLQISPRIFDKIRNDPDVIFRGLGEDDS
jgi:hypothetical protein